MDREELVHRAINSDNKKARFIISRFKRYHCVCSGRYQQGNAETEPVLSLHPYITFRRFSESRKREVGS